MGGRKGKIGKGILTVLLFIITVIAGFMMDKAQRANTKEVDAIPAAEEKVPVVPAASGAACFGPQEQKQVEAGITALKPRLLPTPVPEPTPVPTPSVGVDRTARIASYFQGSASWKSGLTWSGDWGKKKYKKKKFGAFGCGLCCLANVYSSLSPYRCSPLDMYEYAREVSEYKGAGAIEWWNMQTVLEKTGFTSRTGNKPEDYKEFQKIARESEALIFLVSNHNKKSMWEDTEGHYVTGFLYDRATDRIFLADPGSYERNRKWVPLKKIYHSLKEKGDHQYLAITSYQKKNDTWRNTRFTGECKFPANWKTGG